MSYLNEVSSKFSNYLVEKYADNLQDRYSRSINDDYSLMEKVDEFRNQASLFVFGFLDLLENRLKEKGKVVYSNTPFVSEFDNQFAQQVEGVAYQCFNKGIIDILENKVKFFLVVDKNKTKMMQEYYNEGIKEQIEVLNIKNKDIEKEMTF